MFRRKFGRVLRRKTIAPIKLWPGDSLQLTYQDSDGLKKVVCEEVLPVQMTVTEVAVTEHDEVPELDMGRAVAGWFGEQT